MAKKNFYAVKVGMTPGIYKTWAECEANVKGYPKANYKGFATLEEAKEYMGDVDAKVINEDAQAKPNVLDSNSKELNPHELNTKDENAKLIIGADEVGKGEPFRRLIVVSCFVDNAYYEKVESIGAHRDSKEYGLDTPRSIEIGKELTGFTSFEECKNGVYRNEDYGLTFYIYSIENAYYNELRHSENKPEMNANKIVSIMHNRASYFLYNDLYKRGIKADRIVIDNYMGKYDYNFAKKYIVNEKYKLTDVPCELDFEVKAENKYTPVGVASNIATYIEQLYVDEIRSKVREEGGDLDSHLFSNMPEDVERAYKEVEKICGSLEQGEKYFKKSSYYYNYLETGKCKGE